MDVMNFICSIEYVCEAVSLSFDFLNLQKFSGEKGKKTKKNLGKKCKKIFKIESFQNFKISGAKNKIFGAKKIKKIFG